MDKILNRVQNSSLITLDINKFYVTGDREELDIKFFIEDGILREKTFRKLISNYDFIEIYCKASIETCESRDVKGLYKRARAGEIKNYTGIDSPYETPENPELIIDTDNQSLEESVSTVYNYLELYGIIS